MGGFFNRERFSNVKIAAGFLLLIFMAECGWLVAHERSARAWDSYFSPLEEGYDQWHGRGVAGTPTIQDPCDKPCEPTRTRFDAEHSPLWYLIASAPVSIFPAWVSISPDSWIWFWLTRAPYVAFGTLLAASLWYVSRRLYGNAGGFIALGLYCFSPTVIRSSTLWFVQPQIGAAWGLFGAVFTAIAVSHTLYAPREVVLWNWRRTMLLGVSLVLAIGSHFQLAIIVPVLLLFMLYLAPERKAAAGAILATACLIAVALLLASYFFRARLFWHGLLEASFLDFTWRALRMSGAYLQVAKEVAASSPVMIVLVPAALMTYMVWRRCRYFGNTAPLIIAFLFCVLRIGSPHSPDSIFSLIAVVFLSVFVAGIAADLLETRRREQILAVLIGLLAANALWNLIGLARIIG